MSFVRTVLGDIDPDELGITYAHEHLIIDSPAVAARSPEIHLPSADEAIREVGLCRDAGARAMIDAMPIGAGRNPEKLEAVAQATGVHIVMSTGLHLPMYYADDPVLAAADGPLADWFVADVEDGVDRHDHRGPGVERAGVRAGVIKIATANDPLDDRDRRVIEAAATAHRRTGAPILTHCEGGRGGLAQVEAFAAFGVSADRLVLSHTDKVLDTGFHRELLSSGANVEYDQALRQPADIEHGTAWLVHEMIEAGFVGQLMLGTDGARRSMWASLGGSPGLAWLITDLVEQIRIRGVDQRDLRMMLIDNPARCFAFREVSA